MGKEMRSRDRWSAEAVSRLLEAYEAKWSLRNRAKLRGRDWHDVADFVSATSNSTKTHAQCKHKIESIKKRYRSELAASARAPSSSWPLFRRIHRLLRGETAALPASPPPPLQKSHASTPPPGNRWNGKHGRKGEWEAMVGWVAEVMEEAGMEMMKEIERIRMEAQVKRGQLQLKQTQIIADAHLQIATLFAHY